MGSAANIIDELKMPEDEYGSQKFPSQLLLFNVSGTVLVNYFSSNRFLKVGINLKSAFSSIF